MERIPEQIRVMEETTNPLPDFDYLNNDSQVVVRVPIGADKSDVHQIIQALECFVITYGQSPMVRDFTTRQILCGVGNNDIEEIVQQVLNFVMNNITYVPDPTNTEMVTSPEIYIAEMLEGRRVYGDCDDHVVFMNSVLTSLGIPNRILGVKLPGSDYYDHVISSVNIHGRWVDVDPCAKDGPMPEYGERLIATSINCGNGEANPWPAIGLGLLFLL